MIVASPLVMPPQKRRGITLTEILISIMIMGIGMVSLATLFPLGLLRLREASRLSRSVYLAESAASDLAARGLMNQQSFRAADAINVQLNPSPLDSATWLLPYWYASANFAGPNAYDPFTQDTPVYGGDPFDAVPPTTFYGVRGSNGVGLPVAYDPLWRWQTRWASDQGVYLDPVDKQTPEARFACGIGFVRNDPNGGIPSAHGLQRLTNFNGRYYLVGASSSLVQPISKFVASIFVSPEDMVWQDANAKSQYPMAGVLGLPDPISGNLVDSTPSALVPDLSQATDSINGPLPLFDWRYTWMFTGRKVSSGTSTGTNFDGEIVIFENRPFAIDNVSGEAPFVAQMSGQPWKPAGEQVVEAVFGYSGQLAPNPAGQINGNDVYYGIGANRTVLLRWPAASPDPDIKVGSWIADVTYERNVAIDATRFQMSAVGPGSMFAPSSNGQRCFWYQVVKVNPAAPATDGLGLAGDVAHRSMVVQVATPLRAMTAFRANGTLYHVNAALVSPHVVQVIPRSFTVN